MPESQPMQLFYRGRNQGGGVIPPVKQNHFRKLLSFLPHTWWQWGGVNVANACKGRIKEKAEELVSR